MRSHRLLFFFMFVMASACAGAIDLGSRPDARPSDDGGPDAPDSGSAPEVGPDGRCVGHCTPPTNLAIVANASGLACTAETVYVGTTDGQLFAVDRTSGSSSEILPRRNAAVGYLAYSKGLLFYTLPSAGEVRSRDLRDGTDIRLAAGVSTPQGVAVNEEGDVWVATDVGVAHVTRGLVDQTPEAVVTFTGDAGAGGLALEGTRFLVTHTAAHSLTLYSASGHELTSQTGMGEPLGVATSATMLYHSDRGGWITSAAQPLGSSWTPLAGNQRLPAGVCFNGGRLYFVSESRIRFLDVE